MTPLVKILNFLREVCIAPSSRLSDFSDGAELMANPTITEAGACAAMLGAKALQIVMQLRFATPQTRVHLRDCLCALAAALASELEAHGGATLPYHQRD